MRRTLAQRLRHADLASARRMLARASGEDLFRLRAATYQLDDLIRDAFITERQARSCRNGGGSAMIALVDNVDGLRLALRREQHTSKRTGLIVRLKRRIAELEGTRPVCVRAPHGRQQSPRGTA